MADYKKSITFQAKLDTSEVGPTIENLKKQFEEVSRSVNTMKSQAQTSTRLGQQGYGGAMSVPKPEEIQKSRRALDTFVKEQSQQQEKLYKIIEAQKDKVEKLQSIKKNMLKDSKEELSIEEKKVAAKEALLRLENLYIHKDKTINQALDLQATHQMINSKKQQDQPLDGLDFSLLKNTGTAQPSLASILKAATIMGAVGTAVKIGTDLYENYTSSPLRTATNLGGGVQATVGQESQIINDRRSAFEAAFNPERGRAASMALEAAKGYRAQTVGGILGNMSIGAGAGASAGAAGAAIGGPLTALGGGLLGGAIGAGGGAYKSLSDPAQRAMIMSILPGEIGKRYSAESESIQAKKMAENYQKSIQDLKNQNPGKILASQYYEQNYLQNLQAQRAMGLSDEQMYGGGKGKGFLEGKGQFTPEMMIQAGQGILSAGGSSRSAFGNAFLSNQLSRNMDLTNAPQILGKLSGGIGEAEGTKQATIKIIAEGMRLGLDESKFVEENRRFIQATAEIVSRSGAIGERDFERVAGGFSKFVAEPTVAGIGAAQTAYQRYQEISSSVTGPRGVMRMAGFLSDENLKQLSTMEKQALSQVPENELNENNPIVSGLASKYSIPVSEFVDSIKKVNEGAVSRFAATDEARDRLRTAQVDVKKALNDKEYRNTLTREQQNDITAIGVSRAVEFGYEGQRETVAGIIGQVGIGAERVTDKEVEKRMATGRDRGADVTISDTAKDFETILQNFREFKKDIIPTADAISNFSGKVRELMIILRNASESEIPGIFKTLLQQRAATQVHGGKPSK